ncbi:unnamed protein product, partial [Closterium sp. NIES-53]
AFPCEETPRAHHRWAVGSRTRSGGRRAKPDSRGRAGAVRWEWGVPGAGELRGQGKGQQRAGAGPAEGKEKGRAAGEQRGERCKGSTTGGKPVARRWEVRGVRGGGTGAGRGRMGGCWVGGGWGGERGFAHVPKTYRSKLGASAILCVHLGLAAESKGWLLWEPSKGVLFDSRDVKFVEGMMYGGWKKQPETKVSQQIEQITMQLDLTPSVWEEGEEAAAEGGDGEKVQEAPGGGGDDVETSDSTKEAVGSEGGEQQLGKAKVPALPSRRKPKGVVLRGWETSVSRPGRTCMATMKLTGGADVAEQQLGNEEALLILPHGYDPDEEDEPAYCFLAPAPEEPASMEEALAGPDREKWLVSRDAEYQSLLENGTWDLVVLPEGKNAVQCKWVLRIKTDDKGQVTIYKSRLVAKGFMQKEKQDFNEIFAPTAKPPTLRQAPRCWYQKLAAVLEEMGFRTSSCDESLFLKGDGEKLVLFLVYVDDILLFSSSMKEIQKVQQQLMKNFKCKTLGEVKYYLGMHHNHQTGAVSAVPRGVAKPRPYYVLLLQQVLGLEPSPGPTPPLLSPPSVQSQLQLQPASPLPGPSPYSRRTRGLRERREPELRPVSPESRPESPESCFESPVRTVRVGRRVTRPSPPVPGTHSMTLRTSTAPQRDPVPSPPASSLPDGPDPESDSLRAASPTVTRFLATAVTNPLFESTTASALIAELVDFAAAGRLEYSTSLVAESASVCPPSVGGECALGTNVLEDRLEEFECFAAAVPHLVSMLLAPEGDPDAPDIPTPCSYAEAIEGPYSSQWVKLPPGSPPVFKAHYVARGVSQRQGVDFFHTFSPTPKMSEKQNQKLFTNLPPAVLSSQELHAPTSVVAMLMLERELSALRLSEGEPVQPVLEKMRDLYAKLATARITYPEQTKCLKMLSLLPESWLLFTSGLSLPQNQSLWTLEWVRTKILEEDFRRCQLRRRGLDGAGRGAKKDDDSNDQQGGTGWGRGAKSGSGGRSGAGGKMKGSCWYCEKEGHPWFLCYKNLDGWNPQDHHQDGGAWRNQKNGANMVADSSDNNPKSNGGAEKKQDHTAGQFFHIGEQGEQGDASAKVGAELHPLDYWVLDTGAA